MREYVPVLNRCPLFAGMESDNVTAMLGCLDASVSGYERGEAIFREGSPARSVGIVLAGRVQVERVDYGGNRSIMMTLEPGQLFGESFACADVNSLPVSVTAAEDCRVMLVNCRRILTTCSNACQFHNQLIHNLLKIVASKNIALHQRAEITSCRTTRGKLMAYLMMQARQQGSDRFTIPLDRQELADYLEVERSGLSAEIGRLKREGVIDCHRSSFRLLGKWDG